MKIPNIITLFRLILIPVIGVFMYSDRPRLLIAGMILFLVAWISDFVDGEIARRFNLKTKFGTFTDPLVDKMLILTLFFIFSDLKLIPLWMVLLLLLREFLVTGIRQVCSTKRKIVGANWMGKTKYQLQTYNILYIQLFMYLNMTGRELAFFNSVGVYYFTLGVTMISLLFATNFFLWHRKELLKGI